MDHGLAAPFDLDSLRSKVEQRFESVDKLSSKYNNVLLNNFENLNSARSSRTSAIYVIGR